jgi:moderate conductance mechanosensitive channel
MLEMLESTSITPLATPRVVQVCGENAGGTTNWLCELVLDRTGNELLARVSGFGTSLIRVCIILVVAFVISRFLRGLVTRFSGRMEGKISERLDRAQERGSLSDTQRFRTRRHQRLQAIAGVLRGAIGVTVWLIAILMAIAALGFPLQPLLAGAGLAGIVLGFGAQQLVRDVLAGIAMLIEDQYGVGDWIEVEEKIGLVERVGLRSTAFRDVDGVLHHVLNGYIQRVGNLSQEWARATYDVPLALDADIPAAKDLIHRVASELAADPLWGQDIIGPPEIWGVQELGPQGVKIRVVIPTKPMRNFDVTRQLRERLKAALQQAGIRMPSQLVDIGGMRAGYAVLTKDVPVDEHGREIRRQSPAPPRADEWGDEPATGSTRPGTPFKRRAQPRDVTSELRMEQGPQARPD